MDLQHQIEKELPHLYRALGHEMDRALQARLPVEDVVQDTCIKAIEASETFEYRNGTHLRGWLITIARNHIRSTIRRKKPQLSDIATDIVESGVLRPSEIMSKQEQIARLEAAIQKLPVRYQDILKSRYSAGLTFEAAAECRPESAAALRGLHRNAIDALKKSFRADAFRS